MSNYTLTYSPSIQGWTSFYSFIPDEMIGMNGNFYSFIGGSLYKHYSNNTRNNFYGSDYTSKITGIFNVEPSSVKTFKTIFLESDDSWSFDGFTDLHEGFIEPDWFILKEGDYFGFIRRIDGDANYNMRSAQGLGNISSVSTNTPNSSRDTITFSDSSIDSIMSVGDVLFVSNNGQNSVVGTIIEKINDRTVVVDKVNREAQPTAGTYCFYVKNSTAESSGATGYFMEYTIENNSQNRVEIYSIGSSIFKSFP